MMENLQRHSDAVFFYVKYLGTNYPPIYLSSSGALEPILTVIGEKVKQTPGEISSILKS